MYSFSDSDEVAEVRDLTRRFAEREIAAHVSSWDAAATFPAEMNRQLADLGLLGGTVPHRFGGSDMSYTALTAVVEELSYHSSMAAAVCGHPSCSLGAGLMLYGTPEQQETYLRPTVTGERIGAVAVTEPHSGTDVVRNMHTTAERRDGGYVLRGSKAWVSNLINADWFITFATLDREQGHRGVTAFLVDKQLQGLSVRQFENSVGCRTFMSGEVNLDEVFVAEDNRLGGEGEGYKILMAGTEIGRLACSARAIGMLRAVLDETRRYAQVREVYEQPIGRYQLVQEKVADMSVQLEAGRLLTYRLAWLKDQGVERCQRDAAVAKLFTTSALMTAATDGVQVHGAAGCSGDHKIGMLWRDAKFMEIYDGVNEIQKVIIAEHELGYRSDAKPR